MSSSDKLVTGTCEEQPLVDRDELSAFRLRTSVSSISIRPLWSSMQKLGWTHSTTTRMYRAPPTNSRKRKRMRVVGGGSQASASQCGLSWSLEASCKNGEQIRGEECEEIPGAVVGDSLAVGRELDYQSIPVDDWSTVPFSGDATLLEEDKFDRQRRWWRDDLLGDYYRLVKHKKSKGKGKGGSLGADMLFSIDSPKEKKNVKARRMVSLRKRDSKAVAASSSRPKEVGRSQQSKALCSRQFKKVKSFGNSIEHGMVDGKDVEQTLDEVTGAATPDKTVWPEPKECADAVRSFIEAEDSKRAPSGLTQEELTVEEFRSSFSEWFFLLSTGHSLLLYGYGSKRAVLDAFQQRALGAEAVVIANGYDCSVTIDTILDVLVRRFLGGVEPIDGPGPGGEQQIPPVVDGSLPAVQKATAIALAIASSLSPPPSAFLILHNIDGPGLRTPEAQGALAALVSSGIVRIAASVDHVNSAALLWDRETSEKFSWIWKQAHTHLPYLEEIRLGAAPMARKVRFGSSRTDHSGILKVLSAIAPRHTECLQVLASLQRGTRGRHALDSVGNERSKAKYPSNDREAGVTYKEWMGRCVKEMKAKSDHALREMLRELMDHGVVEKDRDFELETEMVRIPFSDVVLSLILNFKRP
mmetsp:Transcript_14560/g.42654  ORF Transcript_14560/g.42654 Transcript_14560/m.42654 type:complete len:641 (-) Transcript_14560:261-2183(-)